MAGTKRRPRTRPRPAQVKITPEILAAFKNNNVREVHRQIGWKPWECSPMWPAELDGPEPTACGPCAPHLQSWWWARDLLHQLRKAAARED